MGILILVHPVPDPTNLHAEILRRMDCRPYVLSLPEYPDDFIPTRQQTLQIGAAIAEYVMEGLYPAGVDAVIRGDDAFDIVGTHLDICQVLRLNALVAFIPNFAWEKHGGDFKAIATTVI